MYFLTERDGSLPKKTTKNLLYWPAEVWDFLVETNLVPRAHVSFGQHQDTELWNNPFQESKILGLPLLRRKRALV